MVIRQNFLSLGRRARGQVRDTTQPQFFKGPLERIIIHWNGPFPNQTPDIVRDWFEKGNGGGVQASYHFVLKDKDVLQLMPLNEVAWHSGDMRNWDSIGICVIPENVEGKFSKESEETLRLLVRHVREATGLNLPLKRHFDGMQGKPCPLYYTTASGVVSKDSDGGERNGQERWEDLKQFIDGFA
jgi:hypothetical protein